MEVFFMKKTDSLLKGIMLILAIFMLVMLVGCDTPEFYYNPKTKKVLSAEEAAPILEAAKNNDIDSGLVATATLPEATEAGDPVDMGDVDPIMGALFGLLGLGALGSVPAAATNLLKRGGIVQDGQAPTVASLIGVVLFLFLVVGKMIEPGIIVQNQDKILAGGETFLEVVGWIVQLGAVVGGSRLSHEKILKGIAGVGFSHSD
jgi:hypothetical protein